MNQPKQKKKSRFLAAFLSFLFPGLGQMYNGQYSKCVFLLIMLIGSFIMMVIVRDPLVLFESGRHHSDFFPRIAPMLWACLVGPAIYLFCIYDAFVSAKQINQLHEAELNYAAEEPQMEADMNQANQNYNQQANPAGAAAYAQSNPYANEGAAAVPPAARRSWQFYLGAFFVAFGVLTFMNQLGLPVFSFHHIWPLVPLALGLRLLRDYHQERDHGQFVLGMTFSFLGMIFLIENWGFFSPWSLILDNWQLTLILVGGVLMAQDFFVKRRG